MKTHISNRQPLQRLWLALRFPHLPAHVLATHGMDVAIDSVEPQVISAKRQLIWLNSAAQNAGVTLGMDITTAQLLSGCVAQERANQKELQRLSQLAESMYQFSPYIETYASEQVPQSGLLLEVGSCLMLFGGLTALSQKIAQQMAQENIALAIGFAHSKAAAWLLSFAEQIIADDKTKADFIAQLKTLPISWLHDFPKQVDALEKMGFVTLAEIAKQVEAQSIGSFRKRFGHAFADYLCELFGIDQNFQQDSLFEKPVTLFKPHEFFAEQVQFDYPLHQIDQLQQPMEHLLQKLSAYLRKRQLQTQHIEWVLSDIYRHRDLLTIYADSPQTHWQLLLDLSLIQLENRELPFEVDTLSLNCRHTLPLQAASHVLEFEQGRKINRQQFSITAAKLKARLGDAAIYKLSYKDSYLPNESNQRISLTEACEQELPPIHQSAQRPQWLLNAPAEIQLRKQGLYWRGRITLIAGPERIQGNWWREPSARDYFIGVRQDQQRLWIFFDVHKQQWFVQGIFA